MKFVQGLKLDRRSVSGLETEWPVTSAFLTLPFLSSSCLLGQAQVENQRSDLYLFLQQVSCCHVFTSNNLENFSNQITAISETYCTFD